MASRDQFQRFLFEHSQVRGAWVQLGESFKEITGQAPYPDSVRELLGESLVASVLMSSTLKFKGTLSLQAAGEGALSTLMAECSHDRHIRGLARFDADAVSGETLHELLGQSRMAITITPEQGQRYQGVVPRESETLAGCLEEYFERSEQIATSLFLFANEDTAAGLLLQRLPGHTDDDDDLWNRVNHLAATIEAEDVRPTLFFAPQLRYRGRRAEGCVWRGQAAKAEAEARYEEWLQLQEQRAAAPRHKRILKRARRRQFGI